MSTTCAPQPESSEHQCCGAWQILEQASPTGGAVAAPGSRPSAHEEDPTRPTTAGFNQFDGAIERAGGRVDVPAFGAALCRGRARPSQLGVFRLRNGVNSELAGRLTCPSNDTRSTSHTESPAMTSSRRSGRTSPTSNSTAPIRRSWASSSGPGSTTSASRRRCTSGGASLLIRMTWPPGSPYLSDVDLAGFPKDRFYLYQSLWTKAPMVHVLPQLELGGPRKPAPFQ